MVIKNELKDTDKVNTLIFDIDFTLAKLGSDEEILKDILNKFNIPYKDEYGKMFVDSIIRTGSSEKINQKKLEKEFDNLPFIGRISSHKLTENLFIEEVNRLIPYDGIKESIDILFKNYEVHALTDWFFHLAIQKINKMDLLIDSVFSTEGYDSKRNLETYKKLLQILNKKECEVIMIGDSRNDIHCSAIGIQSILMDYNENKQDIRGISTAVVTDTRDLQKILKKV